MCETCAVIGVQERAQEGCVTDDYGRQDRAFTPPQCLSWQHHRKNHTRETTSLHVGLPQTRASSQLVALLPNLASASAVRTC